MDENTKVALLLGIGTYFECMEQFNFSEKWTASVLAKHGTQKAGNKPGINPEHS